MDLIYWGLLFFVQVSVELLFVSYLFSVADRNPTASASLGLCCYLLHAVAVVGVVSSGWNLIPLGAGTFVGCWIVVHRKQKEVADVGDV